MAGRHNWNVGTMENWNIGFWETAAVVYWQNPIDKEVNKMRNFHVTSSFQYSLAQTWHAKHEYKELIYEIL